MTLKTNASFQFVYKQGKSAHSHSLVLFYLPKRGEKTVGFVASKKVGNAVVRNRSKRRMRALFAEKVPQLNDGSYVIVAKASINTTSYATLQRDFQYILKRAGGLQNDQNIAS